MRVRATFALAVLLAASTAGHAQVPPLPPPNPRPAPQSPAPTLRAPGFVSSYEIVRTLRSAGFDPLAPPLREGTIYVARATDYRGILMRVVLDARTGAIRDANRIVPGPGNYGGPYDAPYAPPPYGGTYRGAHDTGRYGDGYDPGPYDPEPYGPVPDDRLGMVPPPDEPPDSEAPLAAPAGARPAGSVAVRRCRVRGRRNLPRAGPPSPGRRRRSIPTRRRQRRRQLLRTRPHPLRRPSPPPRRLRFRSKIDGLCGAGAPRLS